MTYSAAWWVGWVLCAPVALSSVCVFAYSGNARDATRSSTLRSARPLATSPA
ncbi:hypothetical protein ACFSR9_08270 [Deinococcus taklimakanensis]|uniref:Uncharacterized protein n=1 Tax=Deinococcus taklimakanensis TaxID=536443 RepID=A0ABW5P2S3_9DEIO